MHNFRLIVLVAVGFFLVLQAKSFTIFKIGDSVVGYEYDREWKQWFRKDLGVWAGRNEKKEIDVFMRISTNLGDVTVVLDGSGDIARQKFETAVSRAIKWVEIARNKKVAANRSLGCFGTNITNNCDLTGVATRKGEMGLRFFSSNDAKQISLIITTIAEKKDYINGAVYFGPTQMQKLLAIISSVKLDISNKEKDDPLYKNPDDLFK